MFSVCPVKQFLAASEGTRLYLCTGSIFCKRQLNPAQWQLIRLSLTDTANYQFVCNGWIVLPHDEQTPNPLVLQTTNSIQFPQMKAYVSLFWRSRNKELRINI